MSNSSESALVLDFVLFVVFVAFVLFFALAIVFSCIYFLCRTVARGDAMASAEFVFADQPDKYLDLLLTISITLSWVAQYVNHSDKKCLVCQAHYDKHIYVNYIADRDNPALPSEERSKTGAVSEMKTTVLSALEAAEKLVELATPNNSAGARLSPINVAGLKRRTARLMGQEGRTSKDGLEASQTDLRSARPINPSVGLSDSADRIARK